MPTIKQYKANHINLPWRTMLIINLHAKQPVTNAAINPTIAETIGKSLPNVPVDIISIVSSSASPKIGIITIMKENCAISDFFTPQSRPVEIVLPERDKPGSTAIDWAMPIINASR